MVGDHMGILGAVVFIFLSDNCLLSLFALSLLALVLWGTVVRFLCNGHYNFYLQSNKKRAQEKLQKPQHPGFPRGPPPWY